MPEPQSLKNHARFDPPFHFFAVVVLLANVIVTIVRAFHTFSHTPGMAIWSVLVALAILVIAFKTRMYGLAAQDRTIRLEERLRYAALLPAETLAKTSSLTMRQIVAMRFASDAELGGLVERAVAENLAPKQIKQSIVSWRADYDRV